MKLVKPYGLFVLIIVITVVMLISHNELGQRVVLNIKDNLTGMLSLLPPIFILIGLLDAWVPREKFMKYMGDRSGLQGILFSILLGAAAAGPLYVAFPVAGIMIQKGVKFSNVIIFLGAWSCMKLPIVLFEIAALGRDFAIVRWALSRVC